MRSKSPAWTPGRRRKSIGDSFNLGRWEVGKRRRVGPAHDVSIQSDRPSADPRS